MIRTTHPVHWARKLKVKHLESFLVLDQSRTLSEAAERMHMTQSAMSHWLSDLEATAGVRLVIRGRRVELTPAGEALKRLAIRILGDVARTEQELADIAQGAAPGIQIGSVTAGIAHVIPKAIALFQSKRPDVSVRITEGALNPLLEGLEKRELDLIIGSLDNRAYGAELEHEILFEDGIAIITGCQHPLTKGSAVEWTDLLAYPWVMPPRGTLMRTRLDAVLLEKGGAGIRPHVETGSVITVESLLRQTNYVAVWSSSLATHLSDLGIVHLHALNEWFGPVGAVWRKGIQSVEVEQFMGCMRRVVCEDLGFQSPG